MPSKALKSMAEKHGVSLSDAERYWDEAVDSAKKQGKTGEDKYAYAMGIVRKRMAVTSYVAAEIIAGITGISLKPVTSAAIDKQTDDVIKKLLAKYFGTVKFVKITPRLSVCAHVPKVISGTMVVRFMQELSGQLEGYEIEGGKFVPKVDNFFIGYSDGKATSQGQFYEVRDTGLNFAVTFDSLNYSISIFSGSMANNLSKES